MTECGNKAYAPSSSAFDSNSTENQSFGSSRNFELKLRQEMNVECGTSRRSQRENCGFPSINNETQYPSGVAVCLDNL